MMKIALIAAMDAERGIGRNNDLMWNLPNDMQFFKATTEGHIVVMGRKNYDSIPARYRPLPKRVNCILSRSNNFSAKDCLVFHDLPSCLRQFKEDTRTLFVIGGGEIYRLALEELELSEIYLTKIDGVFGADTFFPEFDENEWHKEVMLRQLPDERHSHPFTIYRYYRTKKMCNLV
jgi:dihydrofolate reductase